MRLGERERGETVYMQKCVRRYMCKSVKVYESERWAGERERRRKGEKKDEGEEKRVRGREGKRKGRGRWERKEVREKQCARKRK